jgi:hypothetical protein
MEYITIFFVCAVVVGYLVFRKKNKKEAQDTYVCDICGEKECLCHKVEKE